MTYKGKFIPRSPEKYKGDPTNIIYRSSWERQCMVYFDTHPGVIEWGSEELVIPYRSPLDNRVHRYFPDFIIKVRDKNGKIDTIVIEVKPHYQTQQPQVQTRRTKKYITEVKNWAINSKKWEAAREYCADRNWKFIILTEHELKIKK